MRRVQLLGIGLLTDLHPTFGERVPRQLHTLQLICVLLASAMLCKAIRRSSIEVDTNYNNQEPLYKYGQRGSATLIRRSSIQLKSWTICSNSQTTRRKFGMPNLWLHRHLYLNERSGTDFTLRLFMGGAGKINRFELQLRRTSMCKCFILYTSIKLWRNSPITGRTNSSENICEKVKLGN